MSHMVVMGGNLYLDSLMVVVNVVRVGPLSMPLSRGVGEVRGDTSGV